MQQKRIIDQYFTEEIDKRGNRVYVVEIEGNGKSEGNGNPYSVKIKIPEEGLKTDYVGSISGSDQKPYEIDVKNHIIAKASALFE